MRLAAGSLALVMAACGAEKAAVGPAPRTGVTAPAHAGLPTFEEASATNATPRAVPTALVTHGTRAALFAREPTPAGAPVCATEERRPLAFEQTPTYTEKIAIDGAFTARYFVGNPAGCTRKIALPLSFTPPRSTATRTIELAAYVPPRGAFVDIALSPAELAEATVTPGRYAVTFAVIDEDGAPVGRPLSGNPFRLGRDDVAIVAAPKVPARIGIDEELVVPLALENVGDTANRITPLIVFTRPGETSGIEHYDPPELVVPGASSYTFRLPQQAREAEGITPGRWLVTVTLFDAAGDRLNSFAGLPLMIGRVDLRMTRPELPSRVGARGTVHATFKLENLGDTKEKVTAIVVFTKPGSNKSAEFSFTREVEPGQVAFDALVDPAERAERGVGPGVWLVSTAAFRSNGERIKSFTGHYLEID